jgi:PadR family transcriptional regulator, regulatory protein AphA
MEVSPTGYVLLGVLNWGPRTGYEIKQLVDRSTRFFWAASYGQIYPELKRLEGQGLISGESEPRGGRSRNVYSLTDRGRAELSAWMKRPPEIFETRNEGLLKLFLAGGEPAGEVERHLSEMGEHAEQLAQRLRQIQGEVGGEKQAADLLCLRFGIELNEWVAEWCERAAAEHEKEPKAAVFAARGR